MNKESVLNTAEKVKITIVTKQISSTGDSDEINQELLGKLIHRNGKVYVLYSEENDGDLINSTMVIKNNYLSISRNGYVKTLMRFEQGAKHQSLYECPHGVFKIFTDTKLLKVDMTMAFIKINLDYKILIEGLFEGVNQMTINIEKLN